MPVPATLSAVSFLLLGLAVSGHCALMCGPMHGMANTGGRRELLLWMQLGRALTYMVLGSIIAAVGGVVVLQLQAHVPANVRVVVLLALAVLVIVLQPRVRHACTLHLAALGRLGSVAKGASLALVPCPLLMGALAFCALAPSVWHGAGFMAAFAAGTTVPVLAGAQGMQWIVRRTPSRRASGVAVITVVGVSLAAPSLINTLGAICGIQ